MTTRVPGFNFRPDLEDKGVPLVGDKAAIAVLGPTDGGDERGVATAETVGAELARRGYVVVVLGDDPVARAAARGAKAEGGQHYPVSWPGHDGLADDVADPDFQADPLRALARVLDLADGAILLPGGLATAVTLLQMWLYAQQPQAPFRQTVLLGSAWGPIVPAIIEALGLKPYMSTLVSYALEPRQAVEAFRYYVKPRPAAEG